SSPCYSPSSDQRFWSTLRRRVDSLVENRKLVDRSLPAGENCEAVDLTSRLKGDSMLLLRGFDSVAESLSQLSNNLDNALQGAKKLNKPPAISESEAQEISVEAESDDKREQKEEDSQGRGIKRKLVTPEEEESKKYQDTTFKEMDRIKKVKTLAISMAAKASTLARELKLIRSDLGFMQERCALLEEENTKLLLRNVPPDEDDDLVRLQLEALLTEKSRLANENANLTRENRCLHQLVEYHQLTSQDLSASYEDLVRGICLDFDSHSETADRETTTTTTTTPKANLSGFSKSLDQCFSDDDE
ncbi:hypothetical protein M569_10213, partial [Genlisea aurea]